jgi:hypothetical protein
MSIQSCLSLRLTSAYTYNTNFSHSFERRMTAIAVNLPLKVALLNDYRALIEAVK